ncbi:MAG: dCTP deaminase [Gammaproteobacteria bacterium]|jgi:dCTP deaminase|nr:dCTP deaminase [Gammaproteobacteria bacterium]
MTIKSDRWIRRMATEHGMIDPYISGQVRESEAGGRVISYGTSSYGYDIRCADEFKIFTNINSAVVDPKNFDSSSFVNLKSDVCIIPPNSFALARTVEYFRIPRNVLTICLGKSTYARCFRGDTRVALLDGSAPTLEEMAQRAEQGELFWGYSIGQYGRVIAALLEAPRYIGRDAMLELTLDNGEVIHCTPDHEFVLRDGQMRQANDLRPQDSLMPLYRHLARGYEMVYQPSNGHLYPTHRLADEWNLRHGLYADVPGTHRHHKDFDRLNNLPWNIERLAASEHIRLHNAKSYGDDFDPDEHSQSIREALARLQADPAWREHYSTVQRERAERFWHDDAYQQARERLLQAHSERWKDDERRQKQREAMRRHYQDPAARLASAAASRQAWATDAGARRMRQAEIAARINRRDEINAELVREALDLTGSIRGAARLLNCDRSVFRRFPEVIAAFRGKGQSAVSEPAACYNHKIQRIRELKGDHDVYCLTVPEAGNFALAAGVFTSNCGIIVNVTPLEPEWEGHVTLEFSNTTPLPAKVYANEGVAQILFLESDEVCETSYLDRGGKYQGQRGVTLPKP